MQIVRFVRAQNRKETGIAEKTMISIGLLQVSRSAFGLLIRGHCELIFASNVLEKMGSTPACLALSSEQGSRLALRYGIR